jgi:hypothetical protein
MKKYSEVTEQDVIQAITDKIDRGVEVSFSPIVFDPVDFVPKKTLYIKYKNKIFKSNVFFKIEHAQDCLVNGSLEKHLSNFLDEVVVDFESQIVEDENKNDYH